MNRMNCRNDYVMTTRNIVLEIITQLSIKELRITTSLCVVTVVSLSTFLVCALSCSKRHFSESKINWSDEIHEPILSRGVAKREKASRAPRKIRACPTPVLAL